MSRIQELLSDVSVLPILQIDNLQDAVPLAEALDAGGMRAIEMTMRSDVAVDAVLAMRAAVPAMTIGMGTVTSVEVFERALNCDPDFLVTPGVTPRLMDVLVDADVPFLPGVATISEALQVNEYGIDTMKLFPAEAAGGTKYLESLNGPLPNIQFCPTGGISETSATDYLSLENVICVGGTWIAPRPLIAAKDWTQITKNAAKTTPCSRLHKR